MKLFEEIVDPSNNLLPYDGTVYYFGKILQGEAADKYFRMLFEEITWRNDEAVIFGKHYITKRKVAWYGDQPYEYKYSNVERKALPWTDVLLQLKEVTEKNTRTRYNSCLLNLYHTGEEGMAWHSDDEKDLQKHGSIASLTLGAERKFAFKHRESKEKVALYLSHGSLLEMKGSTQDHWMHRLPPTKKVKAPRINLTFRIMEI